ncbi:hypothetical protein Q8F55_003670 [Vanrija albida]|uniref:Ubiquitin-like protease family profile domain-containing protein n=1 Tax=Vanrija albida TaxID=181172 RepID=A0ABR3Q4L6_9TREE
MLQRHKEQAILSGDPHVAKSFSRVQAAYQQDLTKTSRHATRPFATHVGLPPADLSAALGSLNLDNRKPLDETLQGRPVSKSIPKVVKRDQRPAAPPLDVVKGHVYTQLREQDREAERQVRERLQPRIPKDVTDDQAAIIEKRLRDHAFEAILGTATLSASSLQRLRPNTWLNDEVMNFYAEMINTRAKLDKRPLHCMNTFFFEKLSSVGYTEAKLARWTKRLKLDIFALDKLLIPINHDNSHWVCAVINFKQRRIEYYDSLTDPDRRYKVFKTLRGYLESEHKEKKGSPFDLSNWRDQFDPNTPKQNNFTDCGVFACQTLESTARGRDLIKEKFEFNGNDMAFFRRLMLVEIASGELGKRPWGT